MDVKVSVGIFFSNYRRIISEGTPVQIADFSQKGNAQVAADYIVYLIVTMLVYSASHVVYCFMMNPSLGIFYFSYPDMVLLEKVTIYFIYVGECARFPQGVKDYL